MNLTFKQIEVSKQTLSKILASNAIKDFDDVVAIGEMKPDIVTAIEVTEKAFTVVKRPFIELASARTNTLNTQGYNTQLELLDLNDKMEPELAKTYPKPFKFPILKLETIKLMVADGSNETGLSGGDIQVLKELEMYPKEAK